jgi:hypothetical protein
MIFAQVTICNNNPFATEAGLKFVNMVLASNHIKDLANSSVLSTKFPSNISQLYNNYFYGGLMATIAANVPSIPQQTRRSFGYSYTDMIFSCLYNLDDCLGDKGWASLYHPIYGNCFTFNSGRNINSSNADFHVINQQSATAGLVFELFVKANTGYNSPSTGSGAVVFIQKNRQNPTLGNMIKLSTGFNYYVALEKTVHTRLSSPFSSCVEDLDNDGYDSDLYRIVVNSNYSYTQDYCFEVYVQTQVIAECNCYSTLALRVNNSNPCVSVDENKCIYDVYHRLFQTDYKSKIAKRCPAQCQTVQFTPTVSSIKYPTLNYANSLLKNRRIAALLNSTGEGVTVADLADSVLAVHIYMADLKYTSITEVANMSWDQLAANVGGYLGLFLGASVLSLVELAEISMHLSHIMFANRKNTNQVEFFVKDSNSDILNVNKK